MMHYKSNEEKWSIFIIIIQNEEFKKHNQAKDKKLIYYKKQGITKAKQNKLNL